MQIHLIAFDIPFPADYGGAIDVFYKLKKLYEIGFKVTLHCFQYKDRQPTDYLEQFCEKVYYYPRSIDIFGFLNLRPFVVNTRNHKSLLSNILKNSNPVFFEGLHSTFFYDNPQLLQRKKAIRMHNIEWKYYTHLADFEPNFFKKIFFKIEAWKLKRYEKKIIKKLDTETHLLCISPNDFNYFNTFDIKNIEILPAFHPFNTVEAQIGKGKYILFHGNLSISDNEQAAVFLIEKIFSISPYPFIIAGKKPSKTLKNIVEKYNNIELIENPSEEEMNNLIQNAHINLLWSMQSEGIKLKLFYALFLGRFIIANQNIINNTGLEALVNQADTAEAVINNITDLFSQTFDNVQLEQRKDALSAYHKKQELILYTSLVPNSNL